MARTDRHEQIAALKLQMDTFFRNLAALLDMLQDPPTENMLLRTLQDPRTLTFILSTLQETRALAQAQYDELITILEGLASAARGRHVDGLSPTDHARTEESC